MFREGDNQATIRELGWEEVTARPGMEE